MKYAIKLIEKDTGHVFYGVRKLLPPMEDYIRYRILRDIENYQELEPPYLLPYLFPHKLMARIEMQRMRKDDYFLGKHSIVLWKDVSDLKKHYLGEKHK